MSYFNYHTQTFDALAASGWERREFVHAWWQIYAGDRRWTPPNYRALGWALNPAHNPHLARLRPTLVYVDALQRTGLVDPLGSGQAQPQTMPLPSLFEKTIAAAVLLRDPRARDIRGRNKTAYLALFQTANDSEGVERLLDYAQEKAAAEGYSRLLLPTGLSPHLGTGMQQDHWDLWPPLHTPTNPPYVPDLFDDWLHPVQTTRLFHAAVPPELADPPTGPARLIPFEPQWLAADLLPLLVAATEPTAALFPAPDAKEARFLLRWLGVKTLIGRLAEVDGEPVGFVLLQPDDAGRMRRANGGRPLRWRAWLVATWRRPVRQGRLLFGGVLPEWRGRGIGRQLWHMALLVAHKQEWKTVTIGPVDETSAAGAFLGHQDAIQQQSYSLLEHSP